MKNASNALKPISADKSKEETSLIMAQIMPVVYFFSLCKSVLSTSETNKKTLLDLLLSFSLE